MLKRRLAICQVSVLDLRINLVDTADSYASTECERLLGELMSSQPGEFLISNNAGFPVVELSFSTMNQFGKKLAQKTGKRQKFSGDYGGDTLAGARSANDDPGSRRVRYDTGRLLAGFAACQPGLASVVITGARSKEHPRSNGAAAVPLNLSAEHVDRNHGSESYA